MWCWARSRAFGTRRNFFFTLQANIDEFHNLGADLIVTVGTPATSFGAKRAHHGYGIPVVFIAVAAPGALDFFDEGWITGASSYVPPARVFRLMKNLVPTHTHVGAILSNDPTAEAYMSGARAQAPEFGFVLDAHLVADSEDAHEAAGYFRANLPDVRFVAPDFWLALNNNLNASILAAELVEPEPLPRRTPLSVGAPLAETGAKGVP